MDRFRVGAAKECIDPTPDMFPIPQIWGSRFEEVYYPEYVRALAVENGEELFILVASEICSENNQLRKRIAREYQIPVKNVLYCGIHNHGAPFLSAPDDHSVKEDDVSVRLGRRIDEAAFLAVRKAVEAMVPARYGYGEGNSYVNVNRDYPLPEGRWAQADNPAGFSDKTLALLKFEDMNGRLIATVLNHATHANTTFRGKDIDGKTKTCGDFPGFACRYLEQKYQGAVVLWTSGAAGDQNAIQVYRCENAFTGEAILNLPEPHGMNYRYAEYLGHIHGLDAEKILNRTSCENEGMLMKAADTQVEFEGQELPDDVDYCRNMLITQNCMTLLHTEYPELFGENGCQCEAVEPVPTGKKQIMDMQLMIFGDVALVAASGELYNKIGVLCKEKSPLRKTFVVTNTVGENPAAGYIQDNDSSQNKVFQYYSSHVVPGKSNEIILNGMKDMFQCIFNTTGLQKPESGGQKEV